MSYPLSKRIYVITGVPGVGKTAVAAELAKRINGLHLELSALAVKEGFIVDRDEARDTAIVDLNGLRDRLKRMAESSEVPQVIEGHFASTVIAKNMPAFVFVLRRAPWTLKKELEERGYGKEKVRENVEAELIGVCLADALEAFGEEKVCEIDTTGRTVEDVVKELLSIIDGEVICTKGRIDWIEIADPSWLLER